VAIQSETDRCHEMRDKGVDQQNSLYFENDQISCQCR
jgi:hypothetical protein